jgi:hypothetical protein
MCDGRQTWPPNKPLESCTVVALLMPIIGTATSPEFPATHLGSSGPFPRVLSSQLGRTPYTSLSPSSPSEPDHQGSPLRQDSTAKREFDHCVPVRAKKPGGRTYSRESTEGMSVCSLRIPIERPTSTRIVHRTDLNRAMRNRTSTKPRMDRWSIFLERLD